VVTGEVPFRGSNYLSILSQVINEEPRAPRDLRPDLSVELESVIMKALAKDRDDRYPSTEELADDLSVLMTVDGLTTGRARITAQKYRKKLQGRSGLRVLAWAAGIAVLAAAVVFTVRSMMGGKQAPDKQPVAAGVTADAGAGQPPGDPGPDKPAVEVVEIQINSDPQGATIYHQSKVVCKDALHLPARKANTKLALIAELAGYDDSEFTVDSLIDAKQAWMCGSRSPRRARSPSSQGQACRAYPPKGRARKSDPAGGLTADPTSASRRPSSTVVRDAVRGGVAARVAAGPVRAQPPAPAPPAEDGTPASSVGRRRPPRSTTASHQPTSPRSSGVTTRPSTSPAAARSTPRVTSERHREFVALLRSAALGHAQEHRPGLRAPARFRKGGRLPAATSRAAADQTELRDQTSLPGRGAV
jgi:hypothetical protein